jgi:hypothetical protein
MEDAPNLHGGLVGGFLGGRVCEFWCHFLGVEDEIGLGEDGEGLKRLWCSIMDALTWGGGLVVRSVAKESVDFWCYLFWEDGNGKELEAFDYAEFRRLYRCSSSRIDSFIHAKNWRLGERLSFKSRMRKSLEVCMIIGKLRVGLRRYVQKHLLLTSKHP